MNDNLFRKYTPVFTAPVPPKVRDPRLLINKFGDLKTYYAPFEYVNREARIVLVGITPGPTQMVNANLEAQKALKLGLTTQEAMKSAKLTASFSGKTMRSNLIKQLEHWGVPQWLGIDGAARLFSDDASLLHSTSLLRYPTFVSDKDYAGSPDMIRNPFLKPLLYQYFVKEVHELPNAIFFGLGPKVQSVLTRLVKEGAINAEQIASGLLHPSPNNTYRITYLISDRRTPAPHLTNPEAYDAGRQKFRDRLVMDQQCPSSGFLGPEAA